MRQTSIHVGGYLPMLMFCHLFSCCRPKQLPHPDATPQSWLINCCVCGVQPV